MYVIASEGGEAPEAISLAIARDTCHTVSRSFYVLARARSAGGGIGSLLPDLLYISQDPKGTKPRPR
jgi:hypothetical protein